MPLNICCFSTVEKNNQTNKQTKKDQSSRVPVQLFWNISVASLPPLSHLGPVKVAHSSDAYSECQEAAGPAWKTIKEL